MSCEFKTLPLGELITHKKGFAFKSSDYQDEGIPVIRVTNFSGDSISSSDLKYVSRLVADENKSVSLNEHDIVVATVGSWPNNPLSVVGRTISVPSWASGALMNQNSVIIRSTSPNFFDQMFIYYQMKSSNFANHIISKAQGSANQASITLDAIFSYPIWWPENQITRKKAAEILFELDSKVTLLQETNQTLEALSKAVFKSWFVDFDPVRAKRDGRHPEGIDEETSALFPDSFEHGVLGQIPKGWRETNIGSELKVVLGGTPSRARPEFWANGSVSWINSGKVNEFRITTESELITDEALVRSATKLLPARTTVLAITGATLGQVSILEIASCANQSVIGLLQNEKFSTEFIYFWINFNIKKLISSQTGGAQQHINKGNVEELHLLVPDIQILNKFNSIAQPLFLKIAENCFQISSLLNIRDTLIPRLISGQLRLPDSEGRIEVATA